MKLNEEKKKNENFELLKSVYIFSSEKKPNFIRIEFLSMSQDIINFQMSVKKTEVFSNVEKILYEYYPQYKETNNYFLCNGNKIDKNKTLEENKIEEGTKINLETYNLDE